MLFLNVPPIAISASPHLVHMTSRFPPQGTLLSRLSLLYSWNLGQKESAWSQEATEKAGRLISVSNVLRLAIIWEMDVWACLWWVTHTGLRWEGPTTMGSTNPVAWGTWVI